MRRTIRLISRQALVARAAAFALAAVAAACAPPSADTARWQAVSPEGAKFSVQMPGVPRRDHDVGTNPNGAVETNVYTYDKPEGGFYSVVDSTLPSRPSSDQEAAAVLDSACDRVVGSASARQTERQVIFISGNAGRQVTAEVPESAVAGGAALRARVYLVGTKLYEVIAVVPKAEADAAARFLDSFEVNQ